MPHVGKPTSSQVKQPASKPTGTDEPLVDESEIKGSMHTEEPLGWDQAPQAIANPREKRHPRPDGIGGLIPADEKRPNVDEKTAG